MTAADRLAKVRAWWKLLKTAKPSDPQYDDLIAAIRLEADAFAKEDAEERRGGVRDPGKEPRTPKLNDPH